MRQREIRNERGTARLSLQNDSGMKSDFIENDLIIGACARLKIHDFCALRNANVISASSRTQLFTDI